MKTQTLEQITALAHELRLERDELSARVARLNDEIALCQNRLLPGIRNKVNATAAQHSLLSQAIDCSRALFTRPRTITVHGFKIGLHKGKGRVTCDDPARTIELIEQRLPGLKDDLIATKKELVHSALADLDAGILARIGCGLEATGDAVLIKPTDSAVDKIVKALLKSATQEEQPEARRAA